MGSVLENTDSDQVIGKQFLDWLPILNNFIPEMIKSDILAIKDIKNLRCTCNFTKNLVDPFITKLELYIVDLPEADCYDAIAASPLLENIIDLHIDIKHYFVAIDCSYAYSNDSESVTDFLKLYGESVLSILQRIAPRLEQLNLITQDEFFDSRILDDHYKFTNLKSFTIESICVGTLQSLQPALLSMTSLEKLLFPSCDNDWKGRISAADLRILGQAPFLENLIELKLGLDHFDSGSEADGEFTESLTILLQRARNLKILELRSASILQIFDNAPLENLEELRIERCERITSLPASLVRLKIDDCPLPSSEAFLEIFTTGKLPQLKILEMCEIWSGDSEDAEADRNSWTKCMQNLNLPKVESIKISDCDGFANNDVFYLAEAALTLPHLKTVCLEGGRVNETESNPEYLSLIHAFFASSLAANLEKLSLFFQLGDGFQALVQHASNMQHLKSLYVSWETGDEMAMIAKSGSLGGWPLLEELTSHKRCDEDVEKEYWLNYCKELLHPIWPELKIRI